MLFLSGIILCLSMGSAAPWGGIQSFPIATAATLQDTSAASADADSSQLLFVFDPIVVSASRQREAGVRAPASITVIDTTAIDETILLTPVDVARTVPGVDFASKGLNQHTFAVRGDRSVNSTAMLMLTDYRYAAVPSLGFNIPYLLSLSSSDIERIEIVRGPGAAIYGPDSDKGVLHILTKSPFDAPGTRISAGGGERSVAQFSLRHASILGENWGFKLSAEYFQGLDWKTSDSTEVENRADAIAAGADPDTLLIGKRDFESERFAGEARVDWKPAGGSNITLIGGLAQAASTIDQTAVAGAIQVRDWRFGYLQSNAKLGRFFGNAYFNSSNAGDTYILRTGLPVVDESRVWGGQVQHGAEIGETNRHRFTYGVDLRGTEPRTGGTINGRNEDSDTQTELGAYLHSTSEVRPDLDLVAALRVDYHDRLNDLAVSPRLGAVYRARANQVFRLVYNRAYNSPSSTELFIDLQVDALGINGQDLYDLRASGIPQDGYTFSKDCSGIFCMRLPVGPAASYPAEATLTWPLVSQLLQALGYPLPQVPDPSPSDVATVYQVLELDSETYQPVSAEDIVGVNALERTFTDGLELGYKGVFGERASVNVDLYYWHRKNPVGEPFVGTPNVFYDPETLAQYLADSGVSPDTVAAVVAIVGQLPVGTISPDQVGTSDLLLFNRQGGSYDNFGADLALEVQLGPRLWTGASYSWILDNTYTNVDVLGRVVLGVPKNKGSISLGYRVPRGFSGVVRLRALEGFPVVNGVYRGDVDAYAALDLDLSYRFDIRPAVKASLSTTNLLDNRHQEFVGAPEIGRLMIGRVEVAF